MPSAVRRTLLVLFVVSLATVSGCGGGVRVTVPFASNVEYPLKATVVTVTPDVANDPKLYPEYAKTRKAGDPAATVTCLAIDYEDMNHTPGKGPYLVKLDDAQVKNLKSGAKLMLVMDGKNRQHPMVYSFE